MRNIWEFFSSKQIVFGAGAIQQLGEILKEQKAEDVFLITDKGITNAGITNKVLSVLEEEFNVTVFDETVPEPPEHMAMQCYEFAKNHNSDVIIGLGGGSSIDLAKVTALLLAHGGEPKDYFGEYKVPGPISTLIAIPTTAGTGSEVTSVAVITDTENDLKVGISDNYLRPAVALLDPELTVGLPPYVTACTGIDALSHAIEAYTAKSYQYVKADGKMLFQGSQPISDALALQAVELIAQNLTTAVQQGTNLEARSNMLLASLLAGIAFSNAGTAAAHALGYPIGAVGKSPHGEVTGTLLPYVMEFNTAVSEEKMIHIAKAFGVDVDGIEKREAALEASKAVKKLLVDIGLPTRLSDIGVRDEEVTEIANKTLQITRLIRNNPRVPNVKDLEKLLREAL